MPCDSLVPQLLRLADLEVISVRDKPMAVEFKGADKISQRQSQLETLTHVSLRDAMVSSAGESSSIANTCPLLTQIDLKSNLLSDWAGLSSMAEQLPRLCVLDVSHNRISMRVPPPAPFPALSVLVLNSTSISFAQVRCWHPRSSSFCSHKHAFFLCRWHPCMSSFRPCPSCTLLITIYNCWTYLGLMQFPLMPYFPP